MRIRSFTQLLDVSKVSGLCADKRDACPIRERHGGKCGDGSPTYGAFTILTYHLNQYLDLNGRGEWFWDKDRARTGNAAHYGEVAVGLNIMPNRWINFGPNYAAILLRIPVFGSVSSSQRERSQFTAALMSS